MPPTCPFSLYLSNARDGPTVNVQVVGSTIAGDSIWRQNSVPTAIPGKKKKRLFNVEIAIVSASGT